MLSPVMLSEGIRIFFKGATRKINGVKRYLGNSTRICNSVIQDCWNGKYLMTSTGNFAEFWSRDFGWCSEALVRHGYKDEVIETLDYALKIFKKNKGVTGTIDPNGRAYDASYYSIDTLPWMVRALKAGGSAELIKKHSSFINSEVKKLINIGFDLNKNLVKPGRFASVKDYSIRKSSTYDNTMMAMLKEDLSDLGLKNPLSNCDIKGAMIKKLWTGTYWADDLVNKEVTSDSNIIPYSTGVFTDKSMIKSSINSIISEDLDKPLPIRYSNTEVKTPTAYYFLVKNYQGTSVWTHFGPAFIKLVSNFDKRKALSYKNEYKKMIEHYKTYPEILNEDLTLFKSPVYYSDEGMIWAVNYLDL